MTLEAILVLVQQARRSPHARRVLHDALLERYGRCYEEVLAFAQNAAKNTREPILIILKVDALVSADARAPKERCPSAFLLNAGDAVSQVFWIVPVKTWWRFRTPHNRNFVHIMVVRPATRRQRWPR